jgi:glutathionyl-hydroquinone reductase
MQHCQSIQYVNQRENSSAHNECQHKERRLHVAPLQAWVLHQFNTADVMQNGTHTFADKDGAFRRKPSTFRNFISAKPNSEFPAEKDRYALYIHIGCPWAHRANIMRTFKGLEDVIQLIVFDTSLVNEGKGWGMSGKPGFEKEPLYGFTNIKELYQKASPGYEGRCTVPMVWDKKNGMLPKTNTMLL